MLHAYNPYQLELEPVVFSWKFLILINCHFSVSTLLSKPQLFRVTFPSSLIWSQMNDEYFDHLNWQAVEHENRQQILSQFKNSKVALGSGFTIVEAGQWHVAKIASALQSILSWHLQRRSAVGWAWRGGTWQPSPLAPTFALWGLRRLVPLPCWQDMLAPPWHGVVPPARMLLSSAFKSFWCPLAFSWGWLCYANAAF